MRIGGMASGMDIDKIVGDLMRAEKQPLTAMEQKKIGLEWKRDSYREANKMLKSLDDLMFNGIMRASQLNKKAVKSTNESIVTATASSTANNVSNTITVHQLATPTTWVSNNTNSITQDLSAFEGQSIKLNVTNGDGSTAEPVEIKIEAGETLDTLIGKLNDNTNLGISAFYDEANDKIVFTKADAGSLSAIQLADDSTANIFKELGFVDATAGGNLGDGTGVKTTGQEAVFEINGYQTTRSSNNFTINGVHYELHAADSTKPTTVQSMIDTDGIVDTIKEFVNKYNEVIESLNTKLSEKKYRDFPPLTDEQKKDMEENEIELWEEKARSGILRSDSVLSGALTSMRMGLYSQVEGANGNFDVLSEIGIETSRDFRENGKLVINEDLLREKINSNPDEVYNLFNKQGDTFETKGIVGRLRDTISSTIQTIEKKAGNQYRNESQFSLGREMTRVSNEIDDFNDRLIQIENRYWSQFTAMEQVVARYNNQFSMLMGQSG